MKLPYRLSRIFLTVFTTLCAVFFVHALGGNFSVLMVSATVDPIGSVDTSPGLNVGDQSKITVQYSSAYTGTDVVKIRAILPDSSSVILCGNGAPAGCVRGETYKTFQLATEAWIQGPPKGSAVPGGNNYDVPIIIEYTTSSGAVRQVTRIENLGIQPKIQGYDFTIEVDKQSVAVGSTAQVTLRVSETSSCLGGASITADQHDLPGFDLDIDDIDTVTYSVRPDRAGDYFINVFCRPLSDPQKSWIIRSTFLIAVPIEPKVIGPSLACNPTLSLREITAGSFDPNNPILSSPGQVQVDWNVAGCLTPKYTTCSGSSNDSPKSWDVVIFNETGNNHAFVHSFPGNSSAITYSISCQGGSKTTSASISPTLIDDPTRPIIGFCGVWLSAEPIGFDKTNLTWNTVGTDCPLKRIGSETNGVAYCLASSSDGRWSGYKSISTDSTRLITTISGEETVSRSSSDVTYTLTCDSGGKGVDSVSSSINVELLLDKLTMKVGDTVTLTLDATEGADCSFTDTTGKSGIASKFIATRDARTNDTKRIIPFDIDEEGNYDFELTCDGIPKSASLAVTDTPSIPPPTPGPSPIPPINPTPTPGSTEPIDESTLPNPEPTLENNIDGKNAYGSAERNIFIDGLVPCGRGEYWPDGFLKPDCTFCHGIILINNLIKFMLIIAFLVGGVILVSAGILLLLSGVNPNLRNKGKQMATATAVGLIVMVLSWVIVSTIINILAQDNPTVKANFNLTNGKFLINCTSYNTGSDFELEE